DVILPHGPDLADRRRLRAAQHRPVGGRTARRQGDRQCHGQPGHPTPAHRRPLSNPHRSDSFPWLPFAGGTACPARCVAWIGFWMTRGPRVVKPCKGRSLLGVACDDPGAGTGAGSGAGGSGAAWFTGGIGVPDVFTAGLVVTLGATGALVVVDGTP